MYNEINVFFCVIKIYYLHSYYYFTHNLKTTLEHIASIQTGVFARPSADGEIVYLQTRHFAESGQIIGLLHPDLKADDVNAKHILKPGDVLFAAKGNKNFAAVIENDRIPFVASTSFFVIRIKYKMVLPEYLAWFMNSADTQVFLKSTALGSSMASISKGALEKLEVLVPDIQTQHSILSITKYRNREKELRQKIESLQEIIIQQKIINAIKT